jgi:signal transduction histidine kinase
MRKTIFSDVFIICAAVCFGAVICVAATIIAIGISDYRETALSLIKTVSTALSAEYGTVFDFENTEPISRAAVLSDTSVAICGSDGTIIVKYGNLIERISPEVAASARTADFSQLGRAGGMFDENVFVYVSELPDGNFLQVVRSPERFYRYMLQIIISTVLVSTLGCAVIFAVLFYVIRHLLSPIAEMTAAAKRFEQGDFSAKIEISGDNELSFLASSLNDMAASIELTEENRKNFISNVSHELKTPMTTIGGFADGMLDGTVPKEKHGDYLKIVSAEVRRLSRLVSNMLSLSAFDDGAKTIVITRFDAVPLFIDTAIFFEKQISEKNIDISGLDRPPFVIEADEDLLRQVVFNLFENAVKFTDDGGKIIIEMNETDTLYSVSIRNTGKGLLPEELSKVFERFYKTDKSRGIDRTGVGLGLSIVSAIIKLHGGNLFAKSEPGNFTEFEFSLSKNLGGKSE